MKFIFENINFCSFLIDIFPLLNILHRSILEDKKNNITTENMIMNFVGQICLRKSRHQDQDLYCYSIPETNLLKGSKLNSLLKQVIRT